MLDVQRTDFKWLCSKHPRLINNLLSFKGPHKIQKSNKTSIEALEQGNRLFKQKKHDDRVHAEILKYYCKSVAFALPASEQLVSAYMNRSAFLLHICKFQESLTDIERALGLCSKNELQRGKLLCRKLECLKKMTSNDYECVLREIEAWIETIQSEKDKLHVESLMNKVKKIPCGQGLNLREEQEMMLDFPVNKRRATPDSIAIKYDSKYGRHLVAMADFDPGQIIFKDKSYATMMSLDKKYTHCNYCLQMTWSGIPCDHCTWASFCSESCKSQAWKEFHDIECSVIPDAIDIYSICGNLQQYFHLHIRMLITGIKNAGSVKNLKTDLESRFKLGDTCAEVFCHDGHIIEYSLADVIVLLSKPDDTPCTDPEEPVRLCLVFFWTFFVKESSFFGRFKNAVEIMKDDEALFVGSILMRLVDTRPQVLITFNEYDKFIVKQSSPGGVGKPQSENNVYLSPLNSLVNHSCYPNIDRCFTKYGEGIIYALQPIKKGSQVCMIYVSYTDEFYLMAKSERQNILTMAQVICDCPACCNNWPAFLSSSFPREMKEMYYSIMQQDAAMLHFGKSKQLIDYVEERSENEYSQGSVEEISETLTTAMRHLEQPSTLLCYLILALRKTSQRIFGQKTEELFKNSIVGFPDFDPDMLDEERNAFKGLCSEYHPLIDHLLKDKKPHKLPKSNETSKAAREQGNRLFKQKKHDHQVHASILKYYCKSVAFALPNSDELLSAYMNRSAFLIHICKFRESLTDIGRALKLCKDNELQKGKLLCRRLECLRKLDSDDYECVLREVETWSDSIKNEKNQLQIKSLMDEVKKIPRGKKPKLSEEQRKTFKFPVNKSRATPGPVAIKYDSKYGKHLVATADFNPGQIILMEKSYTTMMDLKKKYTHCNYCFKMTWSGIPCDHCTWASFCSESCKSQAWEKFHDIECSIVPDGLDVYGEGGKILQFYHFSIRMLITGIRSAGSIKNLRADLESRYKLADSAEVFCHDGNIIEYSLPDVIVLSSCIELPKDLPGLEDAEALTNFYLILFWFFFVKKSPFFKKLKNANEMMKNYEASFVGSLMVKFKALSTQFLDNDHGYDRLIGEPLVQPVNMSPLNSLINHSCDPNIARCITKSGECVLYALQPIKKGSQIFACYAGAFYLLTGSERRGLTLAPGFVCDCPGCKNDWPALLSPKLPSPKREKYALAMRRDAEKLSFDKLQQLMEYYVNLRNQNEYSQSAEDISKLLTAAMKQLQQPSMLLCYLIEALKKKFIEMYDPREELFICKKQST